MSLFTYLWKLLRGLLLLLAAAVVFIEEFGWRPLSAILEKLAKWPPLRHFEALIVKASPRVALVLFVVPAVLLFPIKIFALGLMHGGRPMLGIAVLVAAKVLGTAFVGRLFVLLEPQLMHFARFRRAIAWWRETKRRVKAAVVRTAAWREAKALMARVRTLGKRLFGR